MGYLSLAYLEIWCKMEYNNKVETYRRNFNAERHRKNSQQTSAIFCEDNSATGITLHMSKDYYNILGISKSASADEIKKAYRKLALKYHPDRGGDQKKFKEINEAYQVLSNPQKKAQYDQFGTADFGAGGSGSYGSYGGFGGGGFRVNMEDIFSGSSGFGFGRMGDIFEDLMGNAFSQVQVELPIKLTQAILGDKVKFQTQLGDEIEFEIPAGTQDGQQFRFRGKGNQHRRGRGDLIVIVRVEIPQKISKEEKELYKKIRELEEKKKSWKFWQ